MSKIAIGSIETRLFEMETRIAALEWNLKAALGRYEPSPDSCSTATLANFPAKSERTIRLVQQEIGRAYGFTLEQMVGDRKWGSLVWARHAAIYFLRLKFRFSYGELNRAFGRSSGSSKYACERVEWEIATNPSRAKELEAIMNLTIDPYEKRTSTNSGRTSTDRDSRGDGKGAGEDSPSLHLPRR